jgi:hypothetical protein
MKNVLIASLVLFSSLAFSADSTRISKEQAVTSAQTWLALVDSAKYQESWDSAGKILQSQVTVEQWTKAAGASREPLGAVVTRKIKSDKFETSLPGVPDGKYFILVFSTSFTNKKKAIETVTLACEQDSVYKVVGYFIK